MKTDLSLQTLQRDLHHHFRTAKRCEAWVPSLLTRPRLLYLFGCRDNKKNDNKILKIATEFFRPESLDRKLTCSFLANLICLTVGPDSIRTSPIRGDIKLNLCMFSTTHYTSEKDICIPYFDWLALTKNKLARCAKRS